MLTTHLRKLSFSMIDCLIIITLLGAIVTMAVASHTDQAQKLQRQEIRRLMSVFLQQAQRHYNQYGQFPVGWSEQSARDCRSSELAEAACRQNMLWSSRGSTHYKLVRIEHSPIEPRRLKAYFATVTPKETSDECIDYTVTVDGGRVTFSSNSPDCLH
ncbi:MAG: hypothetical protein ACK5NY_00985 [Burkholderiaceae bacterium]|jgi:Tfp pilus assembly protein PilE